jgi:hypothetical protein
MSRPGPRVILEIVDDTDKLTQICEADEIFAVLYQGNAFKLKTQINPSINYPGPKYGKSAFSGDAGHAFNLAERLNKLFMTTDFSVVVLKPGRTITEAVKIPVNKKGLVQE